jgi:hypothetical protein
MANEKFDIGKLLRGFAFWKGEVLGKIIFVLVIAIVVCGVFYVLFIRPTHRTTQKAETITNTTINQVEDAIDLQLIPPKIKIGGFRLKLFK